MGMKKPLAAVAVGLLSLSGLFISTTASAQPQTVPGSEFTFSPSGTFNSEFPYTSPQSQGGGNEAQVGDALLPNPCFTDAQGTKLTVAVKWTPLSVRDPLGSSDVDFSAGLNIPSDWDDPISPGADKSNNEIAYSFVLGQAGVPLIEHTATGVASGVTTPEVNIRLSLTNAGPPEMLPGTQDSMRIEEVTADWECGTPPTTTSSTTTSSTTTTTVPGPTTTVPGTTTSTTTKPTTPTNPPTTLPPAPGNKAPVARPGVLKVKAGTTGKVKVIGKLASDPDKGPQPLRILSASARSANVSISGGSLFITPKAGVCDPFNVNYAVSDGAAIASSEIRVTPQCPAPGANQPPTLAPFPAQSLDPGETASFDVLGGATDPEGDKIRLVSANADRGKAIVKGPNVVYTAPKKCGDDTITYVATDGTNRVTRIITIGVICEGNRAPIAKPDKASVGCAAEILDVLANDSDPDKDKLKVVSVSAVDGEALIDETGRVVYTSGKETLSDRADYEIADGRGGVAGSVVQITSSCALEGKDGVIDTLDKLGILADPEPESKSPKCEALFAEHGAAGVNIPESSELYDPLNDRDGDGIACEDTVPAEASVPSLFTGLDDPNSYLPATLGLGTSDPVPPYAG